MEMRKAIVTGKAVKISGWNKKVTRGTVLLVTWEGVVIQTKASVERFLWESITDIKVYDF